jgi:hypothetical protein
MSGQPARSSDAPLPRLLVLDDGVAHEVFEVVASSSAVIQVRSALLFEVGEELAVRIEQGGTTSEATVRVRGHVGPPEARLTELEVTEPRGG